MIMGLNFTRDSRCAHANYTRRKSATEVRRSPWREIFSFPILVPSGRSPAAPMPRSSPSRGSPRMPNAAHRFQRHPRHAHVRPIAILENCEYCIPCVASTRGADFFGSCDFCWHCAFPSRVDLHLLRCNHLALQPPPLIDEHRSGRFDPTPQWWRPHPFHDRRSTTPRRQAATSKPLPRPAWRATSPPPGLAAFEIPRFRGQCEGERRESSAWGMKSA